MVNITKVVEAARQQAAKPRRSRVEGFQCEMCKHSARAIERNRATGHQRRALFCNLGVQDFKNCKVFR
jgi:hypothetical protein